jgi:hypothetical protein
MIWDFYISMGCHWNKAQGAVSVSSYFYLHSPLPVPLGLLTFPPPQGL